YQFIIEDRCYGDAELGSGDSRMDASAVSLGQLLRRPKLQFLYEYDFSDGWEHEILVEKIRPQPESETLGLPQCLAGENACPPEDCGGIFGYYELLAVLADPGHPAHAELKQQYAGFEPAAFDLEAVNHNLQAMFFEEGREDPSEDAGEDLTEETA
ncbi:MAG: plasmid pRiA4b ORF-3 family protein, partial [Candidatus Sericytochromatia bacterium]